MTLNVSDIQDPKVRSAIFVWLCCHAPDLTYDPCVAAGEAALHAGHTLATLHCHCGVLHLDDEAFASGMFNGKLRAGNSREIPFPGKREGKL